MLSQVLHADAPRRISGTMSDRTLGEIWCYEDLHRIMRARANELKLSREAIDAIAGLQNGYAAKLLAPRPIKKLGPLSIPTVLPVLGLKLVVMIDEQKAAALQARISGQARHQASVRSAVVHYSVSQRFLRKIGRKGGTNSRARMSKKRASELGRRAAPARWARRRSLPHLSKAVRQRAVGSLLPGSDPPERRALDARHI
jgi:hypothetical protein